MPVPPRYPVVRATLPPPPGYEPLRRPLHWRPEKSGDTLCGRMCGFTTLESSGRDGIRQYSAYILRDAAGDAHYLTGANLVGTLGAYGLAHGTEVAVRFIGTAEPTGTAKYGPARLYEVFVRSTAAAQALAVPAAMSSASEPPEAGYAESTPADGIVDADTPWAEESPEVLADVPWTPFVPAKR